MFEYCLYLSVHEKKLTKNVLSPAMAVYLWQNSIVAVFDRKT